MKNFAVASAILFCVANTLLPARAETTDHAGIHQVIESFRTAIIQRDKPRFLSLFLQDSLQWQAVMGDKSLQAIQQKNPQAIKARPNPNNNPVAFIDGIVQKKSSSEEIFSNIQINGDSDVATACFDYAFLSDGVATNHGKECWLLVQTEGGWKITTLAWSVTLDPAPAGGDK